MTSYHQYDNNQLLLLMADEDEAAFAELYERFWQKLFAIAYNRLQQTAIAEDVVHDVFASLWAGRKKVHIEQLDNYLATATKFAVLSQVRKKDRERKYLAEASTETSLDIPLENSLHFKKILELVKTEVEQLPDSCRLIFKCSREQGKPVKQIAHELNLSPKTVENQLGKALRQLRLATKHFLHTFLFLGPCHLMLAEILSATVL